MVTHEIPATPFDGFALTTSSTDRVRLVFYSLWMEKMKSRILGGYTWYRSGLVNLGV